MNNAINEINALAPPDVTGEGIGIAILDTGICPLEDFTFPQNRIIAFKDFVYGRHAAYDDNGHGTHVAGLKSKPLYVPMDCNFLCILLRIYFNIIHKIIYHWHCQFIKSSILF